MERLTINKLQKGHLYYDTEKNYYEHRGSHSDCALFRNWTTNSNGELQMLDTYIILNDHYIRRLKEVEIDAKR